MMTFKQAIDFLDEWASEGVYMRASGVKQLQEGRAKIVEAIKVIKQSSDKISQDRNTDGLQKYE